MKKLMFTMFSLTFLGMAIAHADTVQLNDIDTNDCAAAQHEISLLSKAGVSVDAECSPYIYEGYGSAHGHRYDYRLTTHLTVPYSIHSGTVISVDTIDTNDCNYARSEVSLLNSSRAHVSAVCSRYIYRGYGSSSGQRYNYRLYTTVTVY